MSGTRKNPEGLPARVYRKGKSYYYVSPQNRWIRLGKTKPEMLRALAELNEDKRSGMSEVIEKYRKRILPRKAFRSRQEQSRQLETLDKVFGRMEPAHIRPVHVAKFHDKRGETAPSLANRELGLLSHVMRFAIRIGECETNPCATIQRHPEKPRNRYVTDEEYNAVWTAAPAHIRVLMDLAYLTGQRQGDLIALQRSQLKDDGIHFQQKKTGRRLIVSWSARLEAVIKAARNLSSTASIYVVRNKDGQRYTSSGIQSAWQRLMRKCLYQEIISERFTFHDLRAKAGSDADDGRLLGHTSEAILERVYRRKPRAFKPVK